MSLLGYDPKVYYRGRGAIEARSLGIAIDEGDAVFRCNLVAVQDGKMWSYSAGYISTDEAEQLVAALEQILGSDKVRFYPGTSYRHICKIHGHEDALLAECTPPHDIPGRAVADFLPRGKGSEMLRDLMAASERVLLDHPVNVERRARGDIPATMIWLFWGSGRVPDMPPFQKVYGINAALTSGVDLLKGLARMMEMKVLEIPGVTDSLDNDFIAQVTGALRAFDEHDMVVIHVEAPDEAAHAGSIEDKVEAIERVDRDIVSRLRTWGWDDLRLLIMPDHPTPIKVQTHVDEPVPFMMWGSGFTRNGADRFTEAEAKKKGLFIDPGYTIIGRLII
jgi:2,3-bisphosphoglycerate-independent phosphoglycerate mutase